MTLPLPPVRPCGVRLAQRCAIHAIARGDMEYLKEACKADRGNPSCRACQHIKQRAVESHTDRATFAGANFHITKSFGEWLSAAGHLQHCDLLVSTLDKAPAEIKVGALPYFVAAKCSAGFPLVFGAVGDIGPEDRIFVCEQLGGSGDPGVIPKLSIMARSDSHSEVKEVTGERQGTYGVKVYPVREACSEAIAKL